MIKIPTVLCPNCKQKLPGDTALYLADNAKDEEKKEHPLFGSACRYCDYYILPEEIEDQLDESSYEFDPIEGEEPIIFFPWEGELTVSVDPAEEWTTLNANNVELDGHLYDGPLAPIPSIEEMINRLPEIRAGTLPLPGVPLVMHPATWARILDEIDPATMRDKQTLSIRGMNYPVIVSEQVPPGEFIAVRPHDTARWPSFDTTLDSLSVRLQDAEQQVEEELGWFGQTTRHIADFWKWVRPHLEEGSYVPAYYDRIGHDIGRKRETLQDWEPNRNSDLGELLEREYTGEPLIRYLEFRDHRVYEPGYYLFRRSHHLTHRYWDIFRLSWEGPDFCRISCDLLEGLGFAICMIKPGDEFPLGAYTLKAIRYNAASMSLLAKRISGRRSRIVFWAEYYFDKIERKVQHARYRR
jgi:hypothetical protein